jgi:hypothetical protein
MELDLARLRDSVCRSLCADVAVHLREDNRVALATPLTFPDGDAFVVLAEALPAGGVRLTDAGHTLMHLSYSMDVDDLGEGNRGEIFRQILADSGLQESEGELFIDSAGDEIGGAMFRFGQALTRIHDLTFLSRTRVASTFYDDLAQKIARFVPGEKITRNYSIPDKPQADNYRIDFKIDAKDPSVPMFLFGIPNGEKAKLTALIIEHWLRENIVFDSLLVFAEQTKISRQDVARLSNVGGEMVSSLDAEEDLKRKLLKRVEVAS